MPEARFTDKVVLIVGASGGIGAATALAFAREGAKLVLGIHDTPPDQVVREISALGPAPLCIEVDVSDDKSIEALIRSVVDRHGRLDVAFNNAGLLPKTAALIDIETADFDHSIAVDMRGIFLSLKYEIRQMLLGGGGSIINTSSVAGVIADPGMAGYVAAKHGIIGLTKAAGIEYASRGVRVNALAPGLVETSMTAGWLADPGFVKAFMGDSPIGRHSAIGRAAQPEEISGMVLYLASDAASFTTAQTFIVDGGQTAH